jgi:DNA-binding transcriptional MerR regulator
MKKVLPQIAFDFAAEPVEQPPAQPTDKVSSMAGVGFRVKSLKSGGPVPGAPEAQAPQLPLIMPESVSAGAAAKIAEEDGPGGSGLEILAVNAPAANEPEVMEVGEQDPDPVENEGTVVVTARPVKSKRGRKSLKQVSAEADLIEIPADEVLFRKQYYSMGEVAQMFRVNQSLLRFWETEFNILQPRKNKKGDRHFRPVDIKNLHLIYHLLRQRKYTIEGAKDFLKKNKKVEERFEAIQRLQQIRAFLLEIKAQIR